MLGVVYLVFNEGYAATATPGLMRPDLCAEATRLGRLLVELMPHEPEVLGLFALMLLHDARRAARMREDGMLVPLEEQDRGLWNPSTIAQGLRVLDTALALRQRGPYQLQAAIAALHARAPRPQDTDWKQIAALYGGLLREQPGAVVELNAAVALAMAEGAERGLAWMAQLQGRAELNGYHLLHAARGPREIVGEPFGGGGQRESTVEEGIDLRVVYAVRGIRAVGAELAKAEQQAEREEHGNAEGANA